MLDVDLRSCYLSEMLHSSGTALILQGMVNAVSEVIKDVKSLISLWKHECCRVFSDRFTTHEDKEWFEQTLLKANNVYFCVASFSK